MSATSSMPDRLHGTWRLVTATSIAADGSPGKAPYGPEPMGRLVLTPSGRMMAVICDGRPVIPPGETRGYASYCGNYRVEGDCLITIVDAALTAARIGSEQRRQIIFRDGRLLLLPPPRKGGERLEVCWAWDGPA